MKESWHHCRIVSFLVLLHYVVCFLMCLFLKICQCSAVTMSAHIHLFICLRTILDKSVPKSWGEKTASIIISSLLVPNGSQIFRILVPKNIFPDKVFTSSILSIDSTYGSPWYLKHCHHQKHFFTDVFQISVTSKLA